MTPVWLCGAHSIDLSNPVVMGVLNMTPDSFSDGGVFTGPESGLAHARAMIAEGAGLIDVGGESTRPGAEPVGDPEEIERVLPVVSALAGQGSCVSIDTRHAAVAEACIDAGASVINDVSGFGDPDMLAVASACGAGVVVMHMQGDPSTMQEAPRYDDVVAEVRVSLESRARGLRAAGVARERIAVDPGFGFGKTLEHNLALLRQLDDIVSLGYPVLVGISRKRFIGALTGVDVPADRLAGSLAAAVLAFTCGASIVRVHDVAPTVQALAVASAVSNPRGAGDNR